MLIYHGFYSSVRSLSCVLFLIYSVQLWSQSEIKIGVLPIVGKHLNIQYEQLLSNSITVNLDLNYRPSFLFQSSKIEHSLILGQFRLYFDRSQLMKKLFLSTGVGVAYSNNGQINTTDICISSSLGYKNNLFSSERLFFEIEYGILFIPFQESKPLVQLFNEYGLLYSSNRVFKDAFKFKLNYRIGK